MKSDPSTNTATLGNRLRPLPFSSPRTATHNDTGSSFTHSSVSRVDSTQPKSESLMIHGTSRQGMFIFDGRIAESGLKVLQGHTILETAEFCHGALRLYELRNPDVWLSTRQLVFLPSPGDNLSAGHYVWLPLADVSVERAERTVFLSWSDCGHHVQEVKDGSTLHSLVYKRTKPNNAISVTFDTEDYAIEFSDKLHTPCEELLRPTAEPEALAPEPNERSWNLMDANKQPSSASEVTYIVQPVQHKKQVPKTMERGFLVRGKTNTMPSTSRMYQLAPNVDLNLRPGMVDNSAKPGSHVIMTGILAADYQTNSRKVHRSQIFKDREEGQGDPTTPGDLTDEADEDIENMKEFVDACTSVKFADCRVAWRFETIQSMNLLKSAMF